MATQIGTAMKTFMGAVNSATSAISRSLGGVDMSIDLKVPTFPEKPVPAAVSGEQGADTEQLGGLQDTINAHCKAILGQVTENQTALGRTTQWVGNAKDVATSACATFTTTVNDAVTAGLAKMTQYVSEQQQAVTTADSVA